MTADSQFSQRLLFLFLCCSLIPAACCLIPRACVSNLTASPVVCCPTPSGHRHPCGYPTLGRCARVQVYRQISRQRLLYFEQRDFRYRWPVRVYQYACECSARHWGPDCGECWFGYEGKRCEKRVIRKRRNILSYSPAERRQFVQVFMKMRQVKADHVAPQIVPDATRWSGKVKELDAYELLNFAHWLGATSVFTNNNKRCLLWDTKGMDGGHLDTGFPFYHRYLLMMFERAMRRVASHYFGLKDFTLPYWDWTNSRKCDVCTDDLIGRGSSEYSKEIKCNYISPASPFGSQKTWPVYCQENKDGAEHCRPCSYTSTSHNASVKPRLCRRWTSLNMPTVEEVIDVLEMGNLQDHSYLCAGFEYMIESGGGCICKWKVNDVYLHLNVHTHSKGTMEPLASSIFDPLFLLHHLQVDRLVERWIRGMQPTSRQFSNINKMMPMCRDCNVPPFFPLVRYSEMFADTRTLGYTYENFDFGPLSEKIKITHWSNTYRNKTCPNARNMVKSNTTFKG